MGFHALLPKTGPHDRLDRSSVLLQLASLLNQCRYEFHQRWKQRDALGYLDKFSSATFQNIAQRDRLLVIRRQQRPTLASESLRAANLQADELDGSCLTSYTKGIWVF